MNSILEFFNEFGKYISIFLLVVIFLFLGVILRLLLTKRNLIKEVSVPEKVMLIVLVFSIFSGIILKLMKLKGWGYLFLIISGIIVILLLFKIYQKIKDTT